MRKLFLFFIALYTCVGINAQISVDDYIGTWRGEKGDTTFTIKLVKWETLYKGYTVSILGGYSVSVKGQYSDDYLKINTHRVDGIKCPEQNIYSQKEMVCELHKRNLRVRSDSNSSL